VKPVEVKKVKEITIAQKANSGTQYYIQVGSFSEKPSTRFTKVITANGFKYIIRNSSSGNKKLLIGPFNGRSSANSSLSKIKDKINKQAYIVK
jgi:DedD protein